MYFFYILFHVTAWRKGFVSRNPFVRRNGSAWRMGQLRFEDPIALASGGERAAKNRGVACDKPERFEFTERLDEPRLLDTCCIHKPCETNFAPVSPEPM